MHPERRYSRRVIFKRVGDGRPYPDPQLSSRAWAAIPPSQVRLDQLVTVTVSIQFPSGALANENAAKLGAVDLSDFTVALTQLTA